MKRNNNQHMDEGSGKPTDINTDINSEELDINAEEKNIEKDILTDDSENDEESEEAIDSSDELQQKYDELHDSYIRLSAEFDNYRKRTVKEKAELIRSGGERVLTGIITLIDDFERALDALEKSEDNGAMLEGMELIYSKFISFLKQNGVEEIEAIGKPFDADVFEAVTTIEAQDESQKGVVVDCIQKGYKLNDKIIRFPKVVVGE